MKRLILVMALMMPIITNAQSPVCTRTAANQTTTDANITNALPGCDCVTPAMVGSAVDTCLTLICQLDGLISGSIGLQGVLNAGNSATTSGGGVAAFSLTNTPGTATGFMNHSLLTFANGANYGIIINGGSAGATQPYAELFDVASGNSGKLEASSLTGIYNWLLPNEGTSGLAATLVTHTTKDAINVGNTISGNYSFLSSTSAAVFASGSVNAELSSSIGGGGGTLLLKDAASPFTVRVRTDALTGTVNDTLQDKSGKIALLSDIPSAKNLQQVTTVGDTTTVGIVVKQPSFTKYTSIAGELVTLFDGATNTTTFHSYDNTILNTNGANSYSYITTGKQVLAYRTNAISGTAVEQHINFADTIHLGSYLWNYKLVGKPLHLTDTIALMSDLDSMIKAATTPGGANGDVQLNNGSGGFTASSDLNYLTGTTHILSSGTANLLIDGSGTTIQGKLNISTGANKALNTAVLINGTVTVSNTSVTASSKFIIDYNPGGQSIGLGGVSTRFYVPTITAGTSFVINAEVVGGTVNPTDNSTIYYIIIN